MKKSEYEALPDDADLEPLLDEEAVSDDENEEEDLIKDLDETLARRRRRLEHMLEAKRLSKQLFDYEDEEKSIHSHYDDDLFGDYYQENEIV